MTEQTADALVADARRAVHESLAVLPAWEADRVRSLIADLETAVEGRTAIRCAVSSAGPAPATDPAALRQRIADALYPTYGQQDRNRSLAIADAVLAVLPAPDQRAAFEQAADIAEDVALRLRGECLLDQVNGAYEVMSELRRLAGEAQQDPAQDGEAEIVHGCPPDGSGLTPCCGRTPFELPLGDRISSEAPITCTGPAAVARPGQPETEA